MVATRLLEVTTKGSEWVQSKSATPGSPTRGKDSSTQSDINSIISYWNDATTSLQDMASNTIGSMVSSFYGGGKCNAINQITGHSSNFHPVIEPPTSSSSFFSWWNWNSNSSASNLAGNHRYYQNDNAEGGTDYEDEDDFLLASFSTPRSVSGVGFQPNHRRRSSILAYSSSSSPWQGNTSKNATPHSDLVWMFRNNKNPYNAVRGRETQLSSFTAVRSLVALVSATTFTEPSKSYEISPNTSSLVQTDPASGIAKDNEINERYEVSEHTSSVPPPPPDESLHNLSKGISTPSETASQLAEGTIRALRDIALEEAVELQVALRFWNYRWERPLLSWLEAGPFVWTSARGYNHQEVGRKVSQIQAVLARRCAAVGELQQHLLRAGWHRGVAQWGVLGQGGHWAPVAGFDGTIPDTSDGNFEAVGATDRQDDAFSPELSTYKTASIFRRPTEQDNAPLLTNESLVTLKDDILGNENFDTSHIGGTRYISHDNRAASQAHVFVGKKHGDGIFVDDPAFLAEWSVDAIKLIRKQLRRAGNGRVLIPFESNWSENSQIPSWASESAPTIQTRNRSTDVDGVPTSQKVRVTITDIPLMTAEVSALLDIMENVMEIQRFRRLEQLRAPSWLRSNWYVVASAIPLSTLFIHRLSTTGYGRETVMFFFERVVSFFRERVVDPVAAIFNEVWKGRESFSDKKARMEAIESLKKMIRSWLDDTFPEMPESERIAMAEAMDVSMIERKKEESMKTFYEINNVIRMSFIEMQYMKKEMMNALHAIDEMMSANDINMNMAAVTPAVLLVYGSAKFFKFLFYALLKIGKSKEETYASFRLILTDIERLLVMRDNPPYATSSHYDRDGDSAPGTTVARPCVLCADDLGMLMLLIHECRSILYRDRRRFTDAIIRSVAEDLAELAGERGAVSVQQQLRIVGRMCRTYPFLKVISIGHLFQYEGLRHI